ncbi:MAG TPA: 16S rRNA (adenine(1518)-N(6)/adenine(1519)-N(6))-dimethyltransferase RsmA [Caulobacteraceae bacterium]|jgi:16S rRNA (adenine1518-N6/adenine1519-N6)-dimethyltransferase|nr:16S rRNA (adenine(1518)-N(6)/adenine(1519)-N(6))-dimethyltransferase RsmA [Caulobacteraceae bacterium]
MRLSALPPLREALDAAGIGADKRFGQHFLLDLNICRKIAKLSDILDGERVLEVGPGPGGLTRALLEAGARVTAVEKDSRFLPLLTELAIAAGGALTVIHADALDLDETAVVGAGASIVANLPYNIGSPLLVKWLTGLLEPRTMTLMFQVEVARRIVAGHGEADYGRLAVLVQALASPSIVLSLPARAFTPPPKVDSAVVRLIPRVERPTEPLVASLQAVTAAAFGQRRKMLRSSLKAVGGAELCVAAGVDPTSRAETVPVDRFLAMAALRIG